jgi:hypothetical protein
MGGFSAALISQRRSQTQALADLVAKLNRNGPDNPRLPVLARMIEQLAGEIALHADRRGLRKGRLAEPRAGLGLY